MAIFSSTQHTRRHRQPSPDQTEQQPFFSKTTQGETAPAKSAFFQPKLTVGAPNDPYEREADAMADKVVNHQQTGAPAVQAKEISSIQRLSTPEEEKMPGTNDERMKEDKMIQEKPEIQRVAAPEMKEEEKMPGIQKMEAPKEEEEKTGAPPVQMKADGGATASPQLSSRIESSSGKGQSLPKNTQAEMESSFGADFSGVNVHTGTEAVEMNKDLSAQAFTHGQDVYFNAGKFRPESGEGKRLLAHELTHVVQQEGGIHKKSIQKQDEPLETGMSVSQQRSDGPYGWTSSYSLEITASGVSIIVNARVIPDPGVSAADIRRVKSQTALEFSRYFDQRFNFVDDLGQRRIVHVSLNFVDSGENLTINLHPGAGRDDLNNWYVDSASVDRAHELGHQIGLLDEYVDAATTSRTTAASPGVHTDNSLMGNYYDEGIGNADVRERHGSQLAQDVSNATGQNFTSEWSDTYVVRKGDNLSWIARRIYGTEARWRDIFNLNRSIISDPDLIYPGQRLSLPPR